MEACQAGAIQAFCGVTLSVPYDSNQLRAVGRSADPGVCEAEGGWPVFDVFDAVGILIIWVIGLGVVAAPFMAIAALLKLTRLKHLEARVVILEQQVRGLSAGHHQRRRRSGRAVAAGHRVPEHTSHADRSDDAEVPVELFQAATWEAGVPLVRQSRSDVPPEAGAPAALAVADAGEAAPPSEPPAGEVDEPWRWEATVGGEWLNRVGVVLVVVGIALFVGYSIAHLGAVGRVMLGLAGSGIMLAVGMLAEPRAGLRRFGLGLIAGGWGGLYVTTFAAHGVPAARVIDDSRLALFLLVAVAGGMIGHSLRYSTAIVTGLAYVAAFMAIVTTPATPYSAATCLVLAASLLVVADRFQWPKLAVLGAACTYGTLAIRSPGVFTEPAAVFGLAEAQWLLAAAWLIFEAYDIVSASRRRAETQVAASFMPLNLCCFLGVSLWNWPDQATLYRLFELAAAGYAASTVARAVWRPTSGFFEGQGPLARGVRGGYESAVTVAAILAAVALGLRFGWRSERLLLGWGLEAQFLVLAGLVLREAVLRSLGAALFAAVVGRLLLHDFATDGQVSLAGLELWSSTLAAVLTAGVLYLDRWLAWRVDRTPGVVLETGFSLAATGLLVIAMAAEGGVRHNGFGLEHLGVAWLGLAALLLQPAVRGGLPEFLLEFFLVCVAGIVTTILFNGSVGVIQLPVVGWRIWAWLVPAAAVLAGMSGQLLVASRPAGLLEELGFLHAMAGGAASLCIVLFLWHAVPAPMVALAWAILAVALIEGGLARSWPSWRWQGYVVSGLVVARLFIANFTTLGMTAGVSHRLLTVVPIVVFLYAMQARVKQAAHLSAQERWVCRGWSWAAAVVLVLLMRFELGRVLALPGWAVLGLTLLSLGLRWKDADLRWQSYGLSLLCFARSWATGFYVPDALAGPTGPVTLGGFVIACLYLSQLICPREGHGEQSPGRPDAGCEAWARPMFSALGTTLLGVLLLHESPAHFLTAAWGLAAAAVLAAGFLLRDRPLRFGGLGLLAICVAKLFLYDLRELELPYRIFSFMLLGVVLIAASWTYARWHARLRAECEGGA